MYDPTIGQWISEDPIGFEAADPNLRRYVGNQVLTATDPTGLDRYITKFEGYNHVGVAVDLWEKQDDGSYKKIGQRTFDFKADPCWYGVNLLLSTIKGWGKVVSSPGLNLSEGYITFESYPEEDIEMLKYLEEVEKAPPYYSALAHNCIFWAVNAVNVGIDPTVDRPSEEFDKKIPVIEQPFPLAE